MIPIAGALAVVKSHPVDTALVIGIAACGGMLAWHLYVTDPLLRADVKSAQAAQRAVEVEHERQVAAANFERAEAVEKYRKLEQANAATIADLQKRVRDEENARRAADLRADSARVMLDDAETRYLAEQARRAAADPAASCRIAGETSALQRQLRRETDEIAGEAAKAADDSAGKLSRLQDYVTNVCLKRAS